MDGFERFAHGQLITLFSATNYCGMYLAPCSVLKICILFSEIFPATGTANNAGAILVVGRGLVVVPKLIHPLPPPVNSPESSPECGDATWMQVRINPFLLYLLCEGI